MDGAEQVSYRDLADRAAALACGFASHGVARGTRQDAHGVDLNRNFPGTWRPYDHPGGVHWSGPRVASATRVAPSSTRMA